MLIQKDQFSYSFEFLDLIQVKGLTLNDNLQICLSSSGILKFVCINPTYL